ncbi:hypothetical protein JZM24_00560 [Candidatus Sodalis endolongispinus]|uniref:Uncharacterized protein n=1 Tax=Candidatus Sodalis endolongispinus TaxID=2812662 RepID=A0ABS5YA84_9GAMM|nr:hypothetical protein [Candidatus Sodalis endolongispinus]
MRLANLAHAFSLPVSPVGYNANPVAHAAADIPNHLSCEVQDLAFPEGLHVDQRIENGGILLGDAPGLGITLDKALEQQPSASWTTPHRGRMCVLNGRVLACRYKIHAKSNASTTG